MNEFANLQIRVQQDDVPKAADSLDRLADAAIRTDGAVSGLGSSAPVASRAVGGLGDSGKKASTGLDAAGNSAASFATNTKAATKTGREFETALAGMETGSRQGRAMMQNLSWQIQDVAVQAQMGVSSLTILAQQGPQMLSVFGAGGAVAGGLLAVGALLATLARDADAATESFDEMMSRLDQMNQAQRVAFEIKTVDEHNKLVEETNRLTAELSVKFQELEREKLRSTSSWKLWADNAKENIDGILTSIDLLKGRIEDNKDKINEYRDGMAANAEGANGMSQAVKTAADAIELEAKSVNASTFEKKKWNLEKELGRELTEQEAAAIRRATGDLDAQTKAKKDAAAAERAALADKRKADREVQKDLTRQMQLEKQADAWLSRVDYYGQSEVQRIQVWQDQELQQLKDYLDKKAITAEEGEAAYNAIIDESGKRRMDLYTREADHKAAEDEKIRKSQEAAVSMWLDTTGVLLDATATMLEQSGMENSGVMKALLAAQKALAIPSILVSTEQAAMAALAHESLAGGLISGQMAAQLIRTQGAISAGIVAGTAIAGLFDNGGIIPAGQMGIVGEFGPEFVKGPAVITSRAKTAEMARAGLSGGSGGGTTNVVNNYITVTGNGDQALARAMEQAAKKGTNDALAQVRNDATTNGPIRRTYGV